MRIFIRTGTICYRLASYETIHIKLSGFKYMGSLQLDSPSVELTSFDCDCFFSLSLFVHSPCSWCYLTYAQRIHTIYHIHGTNKLIPPFTQLPSICAEQLSNTEIVRKSSIQLLLASVSSRCIKCESEELIVFGSHQAIDSNISTMCNTPFSIRMKVGFHQIRQAGKETGSHV